jgi:hypothetical protein
VDLLQAQGLAVRKPGNFAKLSLQDLIAAFTGGDAEIASGHSKWWQSYNSLPDGQRPFQSPYSEEQQAWLDKALQVYRQGR